MCLCSQLRKNFTSKSLVLWVCKAGVQHPESAAASGVLRDEDWGGGSVTAELFTDHRLTGMASRGRETTFQARDTAHLLSVRVDRGRQWQP